MVELYRYHILVQFIIIMVLIIPSFSQIAVGSADISAAGAASGVIGEPDHLIDGLTRSVNAQNNPNPHGIPDDIYLINKNFDGSYDKNPIFDIDHYGRDVYIIQFAGPVLEEWVEELEAAGLMVLDYIPDFAFIVRGDVDNLYQKCIVLDSIKWIGEYKPFFKIEKELVELYTGTATSDAPDTEVDVNIMVYDQPGYFEDVLEVLPEMGVVTGDVYPDTNIIRSELQIDRLPSLAALSEIEWIERYYEKITFMNNIRNYTGADFLDLKGFNGSGIVGEVKDSGFDKNHPDFVGQIKGTDGTIITEDHGTSTFGIVFGSGANSASATGMLPGGQGIMCDWDVTRTSSISNLVNNWGGLFQSNSWGTSSMTGVYSTNSRTNDLAVFDDHVTMLYAAGNSNFGIGKTTLTDDAASKNIITVGGVSHYNNKNRDDDKWVSAGAGNTPSQGPTSDNRIKPDLCGPFDGIYTTDIVGTPGYSTTNYFSSFGGTSGATPVVAGTVGLVYQMYGANIFENNATNKIPAPSTVKALLIANAYQLNLTNKAARHQQGWGLPDLEYMYNTGKYHLIVNETKALKTGTNITYKIYSIGTQPMKISLVWTDYRGTPSASKYLVNDLDLKVTCPLGKTYYGNFDLNNQSWSVPSSTPRWDRLNNVENVFIQNPTCGEWTIEVSGFNVPQDGDIRTGDVDQAFGLVASGVRDIWSAHDVAASSLKVPDYVEPDKPVQVNASVFNFGYTDEQNIKINLTVNGTVINSTTISILDNLTGADFEFTWVPSTGVHEVAINVSPVPGENERANNNFSKIVIAEPDVMITSLAHPQYGVLNETFYVNASVENLGEIALTGVNVTFSENGTVMDWKLIDLDVSEIHNVSFNWTPKTNGLRLIKIESLPVANESLVYNNNQSSEVLVTKYRPVKVFILDSWGNDNPAIWDELNINWSLYGPRPIIINYTGFKDVTITYSDLTGSGADVLVISEAYNRFAGWQFSDAEIAAVKQYTGEGHGLVITGYTFFSFAQNNYKFAPLVGINDGASSTFNTASLTSSVSTYFPAHPLLTSIPALYTPLSTGGAVPADRFWDDADMSAGVILAGNHTNGFPVILDNHGVYYISNWLELNPTIPEYQLLYNAFSTSMSTKYDVDLSLQNITGPSAAVPFGTNITYNISAHNIGMQTLNNINVTFYINETMINSSMISSLGVGSHSNLTFKWYADKLGDFDAIINVTPFAGENYTYDNVRHLLGTVIPNPEITVTPTRLDAGVNETDIIYRSILITNTGLNPLTFSLSNDGNAWISFNVSSGVIRVGGQQSINVTLSAASLTKGKYTGRIWVLSNDIDEPTTQIPVIFLVYGTLRDIKITPENHTVNLDTTVQYAATGYDINHDVISFNKSWDTTDPIGFISSEGVYYPGAVGNWTIYCIETDGFISNFTTVNVEPSDLDHIDLSPLSIDLTADDTQQFNAVGRNATNAMVIFTPFWSTDDPWGVIDQTGLYRPGMAGQWNVTCSNFRGTVTASATVNVSPGALAWIDLSPKTWTGKSSSSVLFTATGYDLHDNIALFTEEWSTTDPKGTISTGGYYTAGTAGIWKVKCNNLANTVNESATVTVTTGDLSSIRITQDYFNITTDYTIDIDAVGLDLNGNEIEIVPKWKVDGGGLIDSDTGIFEATTVGTWFVYANYSGYSDDAVIDITYGALEIIQVMPIYVELKPNEYQQFSAVGFDADINERPITPTFWVTGGGTINPATGYFQAKTAGTWRVYANDSGVQGFSTFKVLPGDLKTIFIDPANRIFTAGESLYYRAEGRDSEGNVVDISPGWMVDGGGSINPTTGQFTAEKAGIWTVTAYKGDIVGSTSFTVLPAQLDRIEVDPSSAEITADDVQRFNASGYDTYRNIIEITPTWSVSGEGVVNISGYYHPTKAGRWEVIAEYSGLSGVASVIVHPGKPNTITIKPENPTVTLGETIDFNAKIIDGKGNVIDDYPFWTTEPGAGVINSTGSFYAKLPGKWNVTAHYGGISAATTVNIVPGEDTDGDGMSDSWELENALNPLNPADATEDNDGDSLSNRAEFENRTDPNKMDTDSDGMDDYWEINYGLDPLDASDADSDADSDGFSNKQEYDAATDPTDSTSHPAVEKEKVDDAGLSGNILWMIIAIIVIVIIVVIISVYAYGRRREEDVVRRPVGEREPEIIDVSFDHEEEADMYEDEYEEDVEYDVEFELDEEEVEAVPPPPPAGEVKFRKVKDKKKAGVAAKKKKAVKGKGKPLSKSKKIPVRARKKRAKVKPAKKRVLKKFECPRCSEPITVPYSTEARVSLKCPFCGGKGKIPNPYRTAGKVKAEDEEISWDEAAEEEDGERGKEEDIEEVDEITWDDHMRYREPKGEEAEEEEILWDADDEKPYKRAKKKVDEEFLWD